MQENTLGDHVVCLWRIQMVFYGIPTTGLARKYGDHTYN